MEKQLLQVGQHFTTNGGLEVVCYEVTDQFAFLAPVEVTEEELILIIDKTLVYRREINDDVLSPIQSISFEKENREEKAE